MMKNYFDEQAAEWDNDPVKMERAMVFAKEIKNFIPNNKTSRAMEYGAGTGLLSFQLKDFFKSITLADSSLGMLKVLNEKINKAGLSHFKPLSSDLLKNGCQEAFDVIYLSMTLHHIIDVEGSLKAFNDMLTSGGYLCIADLVEEDGSFHSNHPEFDGHNGFDKDALSELLVKNGFMVEYYNVCFVIEKTIEHQSRTYPLFLLIARKIT